MIKDFNVLFEENVKRNPEKKAIIYDDGIVTYAELDEMSNRVAYFLKNEGACTNDIISVVLDRTIDFYITVLGIIKIGAGYLPIDPTYPSDRINYILNDSNCKFIITSQNTDIITNSSSKKYYVEEIKKENNGDNYLESINNIDPEDTAYVIYTSGSTGKPKGVNVPRRGLNNLLSSMKKNPGFSESDTLLALISYSFDMSVAETFLPLYVGGTIVIGSKACQGDGSKIINMLNKYDITFLQGVPTSFYILLESGWEGKKDLKIVSAGEALPRNLANKLIERCYGVWNMYGPTETTVYSTIEKLELSDECVPIGKPIDNTYLFILDDRNIQVNKGEIGELYIGGLGVAKGYLGKEQLTNERFVINNNCGYNGIIYKTGDLVRELENGSLEYIGRTDFQVKLRGFRIELNEIEAVLESHKNIVQAVVVVNSSEQNNQNLVCYYRYDSEFPLIDEEIKEFLKNKLPVYMIPSAFIPVLAFPLTPNGKVNRKELSDRNVDFISNEREIILPQTQIEKDILSIWTELLNLDEISIDENFFDLGGHSLLANKLVVKINDMFNIDLSLLDVLIKGQTISELAQIVEDRIISNAGTDEAKMIKEMLDKMSPEELKVLEGSIK